MQRFARKKGRSMPKQSDGTLVDETCRPSQLADYSNLPPM